MPPPAADERDCGYGGCLGSLGTGLDLTACRSWAGLNRGGGPWVQECDARIALQPFMRAHPPSPSFEDMFASRRSRQKKVLETALPEVVLLHTIAISFAAIWLNTNRTNQVPYKCLVLSSSGAAPSLTLQLGLPPRKSARTMSLCQGQANCVRQCNCSARPETRPASEQKAKADSHPQQTIFRKMLPCLSCIIWKLFVSR